MQKGGGIFTVLNCIYTGWLGAKKKQDAKNAPGLYALSYVFGKNRIGNCGNLLRIDKN